MDSKQVVWVRHGDVLASAVVQDGRYFPRHVFLEKFELQQIYIGKHMVPEWALVEDLVEAAPTTGQRGTEAEPFIVNGDKEVLSASVLRLALPGGHMAEQVDCFIRVGKEKAWKLRTLLRKPLPKTKIAQHFNLWEPTMRVLDGTLEEIWRSTPLFGSSPNSPMQLYGFYGPLVKDSIARMVPSAMVPSAYAKPVDVRLKECIYESTATHVYAAEVVGGRRDGQGVAIKINYDPHKNEKSEEARAWGDLSVVLKRKKGMNSLPTVMRGTLEVDGCHDESSNNPEAHLIWPLGECIKGMVFRGSQLAKLAFDMVLALYHLALAGRRHRDVCTDNMIFVRNSNQFVLIDLKLAYEDEDEDFSLKRSWPSDCVWLVLSLVELCTLQKWCLINDVHSAAEVLASENQTLCEFATHVATSYSEEKHDRHFLAPWLARLAEACSIAQADLDKLL